MRKVMKNLVLPDIDLNKEVNKCSSMEDLVGKNGFIIQAR